MSLIFVKALIGNYMFAGGHVDKIQEWHFHEFHNLTNENEWGTKLVISIHSVGLWGAIFYFFFCCCNLDRQNRELFSGELPVLCDGVVCRGCEGVSNRHSKYGATSNNFCWSCSSALPTHLCCILSFKNKHSKWFLNISWLCPIW